MTYAAKIIADSIASNVRLTTMEVTFPRIVLAEFNTHRVFSRNSASSRAIPVSKRIQAVRDNPFVPESFGRNQKGMQAADALTGDAAYQAREIWMRACEDATQWASMLAEVCVHKQLANRILEPFSWHTVVVTATEWQNYFALRCSSLAQPEIRIVSEMMEAAYRASKPVERAPGEWHLPYVREEDFRAFSGLQGRVTAPEMKLVEISTARCARVSYLTHDGRRDLQEDFRLHDDLLGAHHMSPFEHPAFVDLTPAASDASNFRAPWVQYRKLIPGEAIARREH